MKSSREAYERYLHSPAWKAKRLQALEAADFHCAGCSSTDALQVHHLTYERLGFERITDLMVLCEQCHALEHGKAMRAGMPIGGLSITEMSRDARQHDELRRLHAGQGRDVRSLTRAQAYLVERRPDVDESPTALRGITTPPQDEKPACDGSYTCDCEACHQERKNAISRGHRPRRPLPLKRAA